MDNNSPTLPNLGSPPGRTTRRSLRVLIPAIVVFVVVAGFAAIALGHGLSGSRTTSPTANTSHPTATATAPQRTATPQAVAPSSRTAMGCGSLPASYSSGPALYFPHVPLPASSSPPNPSKVIKPGQPAVTVCGIGFHSRSQIRFTIQQPVGASPQPLTSVSAWTDNDGTFISAVPPVGAIACSDAPKFVRLTATDAQGATASLDIPTQLGILEVPPCLAP